jgi:hypothetical protein
VASGRDEFERQLRELEREPTCLQVGWLSFAHRISSGNFKGREVVVALQVPDDFPSTPPSGPHVKPRLRPNSSADKHPDRVADSPLGAEWMYLSRPYREPGLKWTTKRGVKGYLDFVTWLLETL